MGSKAYTKPVLAAKRFEQDTRLEIVNLARAYQWRIVVAENRFPLFCTMLCRPFAQAARIAPLVMAA
jgi:hypothetical protein